MSGRFIISTDLDGTLLDHHDYSWAAAAPALQMCRENDIPVMFNTSKTAAESAYLQSQLGLSGPVCVENGSALLLDDDTVVFGTAREVILNFLERCRTRYRWQFVGFNDWTTDDIADQTGLTQADAERAANKLYSEPFLWQDSEPNLQRFRDEVGQANLKLTQGGRFFHLQGQCDKSTPLRWLKQNASVLFSGDSGKAVPLICLGDGNNDIEMLEAADIPVCVRSPVHDFPKLTTPAKIFYTHAMGPAGWNEAITRILGQINHG